MNQSEIFNLDALAEKEEAEEKKLAELYGEEDFEEVIHNDDRFDDEQTNYYYHNNSNSNNGHSYNDHSYNTVVNSTQEEKRYNHISVGNEKITPISVGVDDDNFLETVTIDESNTDGETQLDGWGDDWGDTPVKTANPKDGQIDVDSNSTHSNNAVTDQKASGKVGADGINAPNFSSNPVKKASKLTDSVAAKFPPKSVATVNESVVPTNREPPRSRTISKPLKPLKPRVKTQKKLDFFGIGSITEISSSSTPEVGGGKSALSTSNSESISSLFSPFDVSKRSNESSNFKELNDGIIMDNADMDCSNRYPLRLSTGPYLNSKHQGGTSFFDHVDDEIDLEKDPILLQVKNNINNPQRGRFSSATEYFQQSKAFQIITSFIKPNTETSSSSAVSSNIVGNANISSLPNSNFDSRSNANHSMLIWLKNTPLASVIFVDSGDSNSDSNGVRLTTTGTVLSYIIFIVTSLVSGIVYIAVQSFNTLKPMVLEVVNKVQHCIRNNYNNSSESANTASSQIHNVHDDNSPPDNDEV